MTSKLKRAVINGVVYTKKEDGAEKVFSRFDEGSKMELVNVFRPHPDSKDRMEAFKASIASLLNSSD